MKSLTAPEWYDESGNLVKAISPKYIRTVKIYSKTREEVDSAFVTIITSSSVDITNRETFIQCLGNDKGKIIAVSGYKDDGNTHYTYCGYLNSFGTGSVESIQTNSGLYHQTNSGRVFRSFDDITDSVYMYAESSPIM